MLTFRVYGRLPGTATQFPNPEAMASGGVGLFLGAPQLRVP